MTHLESALAAVRTGLDEVNEQLDPAARLAAEPGTVLFGPDSRLDSLGLVTLLVAVERNLQRATGRRVALATNDQLYGDDSPLRTVGSFAQFLAGQLGGPS